MITTGNPFRQEKGVVLVLVALSLLVLMGVAALAIDLSHSETNATRLQNLADALALSAAISLNKQEYSVAFPDKEQFAENYSKTVTLPDFKSSSGNNEVTSTAADFTYTFATDWSSTATNWKAANAIDGARFVRVTMNNPMNVTTWFAKIMGFSNMAVSASAVAGTAPINPCQNTLPIMMCTDASPHDTNCKDNTLTAFGNTNNDCYGYELNVVYATKESKWQAANIGPGNFGYFDVGSGKNDIRNCLAGDPACTSALCSILAGPGGTITSEPGNAVGPGEQGLNTRFDIYKGPVNYGLYYLPDSLVGDSLGITLSDTPRDIGSEFDPAKNYTVPPAANPSAQIYNYYYKDHYQTATDVTDHSQYSPGRRLVTMPLVACNPDGNGKTPETIVTMGCFFLTAPSDGKIIYAEFIGAGEACPNGGTVTSTNNFGYYKVQLYKDPFGGHS